MPRCPTLAGTHRRASARHESVVLAVYAPFGADDTLSTYPGNSVTLQQHPLVKNLQKVAALGVHVSALIDRVGHDTMLVEIPAFQPAQWRATSAWKQDMGHWRTLAGFLRRTAHCHPTSTLVLAMEGHGAGYLPELDRRHITTANVTDPANGHGAGPVEWRTNASGSSPVLPTGAPILPTGAPILPTGAPILPAGPLPISTWGLGQALRSAQKAGCPRPAVVHFNNCFNMSVELLHTIAPHADFATGYINYNFFTAGESYPAVFQQLASQPGSTAEQLATWFAQANGALLGPRQDHPTVGATVRLARMRAVGDAVDGLADALLQTLRTAPNRLAERNEIRAAILAAQQLDTVPTPAYELASPDQLTDLRSLANALLGRSFFHAGVQDAAKQVLQATEKIKVYGHQGQPWMAPGTTWNFTPDALAMNILLPDPGLDGLWDWRSPYYLDINPSGAGRLIQPQIIDFLTQTNWAEFIVEYHKDAAFKGLLPALAPQFPVYLGRDGKPPSTDPKVPGQPGSGGGSGGVTAPTRPRRRARG
jgi:hypothetical protein